MSTLEDDMSMEPLLLRSCLAVFDTSPTRNTGESYLRCPGTIVGAFGISNSDTRSTVAYGTSLDGVTLWKSRPCRLVFLSRIEPWLTRDQRFLRTERNYGARFDKCALRYPLAVRHVVTLRDELVETNATSTSLKRYNLHIA